MKSLNDFLNKEPDLMKLLSILDLDHETMTYLFEIALREDKNIQEVIKNELTRSRVSYQIAKLFKEII